MDQLNSMKIFMNVADMESFTQAADSLNLPKATVSAAVQQLESQVGARLLNRTTRVVKLTQDGLLFYERCRNVLSDMDDLEGLFKQSPKDLSGKVRVGLPSRAAKNLIIPKLPEFLNEYSNIEIELGTTDRFVDLVQEGIDFVVRGGELQDSNLVAKPVGVLKVANLASASYIKKYGMPKSIADLNNHYEVHYTTRMGGKISDWEYVEDGKVYFMKMKGFVTVSNADSYLDCCLAGLGLIQLPRFDVVDMIEDGTLIEVLPKYLAEPMPVSIVYPHRKHISRRAQAFMTWIESQLKTRE